MEEMFFKYKDNGGIKTKEGQDNALRRYLKRFKNFTKKYEKVEGLVGEGNFSGYKLEGMGFDKSNPRRFAERMIRGGERDKGYLSRRATDDEDNKPKGRSTCEAIGLCPCVDSKKLKHYR